MLNNNTRHNSQADCLPIADIVNFYYPRASINAPRPDGMSVEQYINFLAIQVLEEMGNDSPTQEAINIVEIFISEKVID